jgi:hypothetical protein
MIAEIGGLLISGVSGVTLPLMEKAFGAAARAKALNLSFIKKKLAEFDKEQNFLFK